MKMSKKESKAPDGLIWANAIVPDPAKGGSARRNLAFRCASAEAVPDGCGGIACVRIHGGAHDGYEIFPAYGVSLRRRAPKGHREADVAFQGRLC